MQQMRNKKLCAFLTACFEPVSLNKLLWFSVGFEKIMFLNNLPKRYHKLNKLASSKEYPASTHNGAVYQRINRCSQVNTTNKLEPFCRKVSKFAPFKPPSFFRKIFTGKLFFKFTASLVFTWSTELRKMVGNQSVIAKNV